MKYYAHTKENEPENSWQLLKDHLLNTAEISKNFAIKPEIANIFYIAGLMHDFGKYQDDFQKYLKKGGKKGSVPHASWGAGYARNINMPEVSFVIDGHHKGLPDRTELKNDTDQFKNGENPNFENVKNNFISELDNTLDCLRSYKSPYAEKLEQEYFIRHIFSALTDADWLNTEEFCDSDKSKFRTSRQLDYDVFIDKLETTISKKSKDGDLNILRNKVRQYAIGMSTMPHSFYSMNLPTGMGKTLASLSWALHHAKHNKLKRIIIVLPFINIIDQTAGILKDIFGGESVLEHHSGYNEFDTSNEDDDIKETNISKKLATENWDFPIIVTTTVQFFESIFSNKPSKCRKIHNVAESVVIFDEVQSLRKEIVLPTLSILKNMNKIAKTSFLFCTATQPAFEKREKFDGIENIIPLVENCDELFEKTRRVTYYSLNSYNPIEIDILLKEVIEQNKSALCIFNTKKTTYQFFSSAKNDSRWEKIYHLSTLMCPHHRKSIICDIRNDLKKGRIILVSSTQLIEAGVDFDFPCVFREYAPMESIIQSAGRCNREGLMQEYGKVYIFKLNDSGVPDKQYRNLANHTIDMISSSPDRLYQHDFFRDYYSSALNLFVEPDKYGIIESRKSFNFRTVAESYQVIDKATRGLFIWKYNEESAELLQTIRRNIERGNSITRELFRKIQNYSVQVYNKFLIESAEMYETLPQGLLVWHGKYSNETGIIDNHLTADELIV